MDQEQRTRLRVELQRGVPLEERPFAALAARLGLDEAAVLGLVQSLFDAGQVRRFGTVFDGCRLGFRSALCAAQVPPADLPQSVAPLLEHPGVTHCYLRGWPDDLAQGVAADQRPRPDDTPNLWFTLVHPAGEFAAEAGRVRRAFGSVPVHVLPALRRFKIDVILGAHSPPGPCAAAVPCRTESATADASGPGNGFQATAADRALIRMLQGHLPLCAEPFAAVAARLGCPVADVLARLRAWQAAGIARRTGITLNHRRSGFTANGLCVWAVPEAGIEAAGRRVAARPEVTHCYQRPRLPQFPFDLYAMVHAAAWGDALALFADVSRGAGLEGGRVLFSLHEYKKTSPVYFAEASP
jgi:DNA-binding Lrp family transcriptional regulator